jgi:hypothetical protein
MIRVAEHAVERFVEYFRPGMPHAEAEQMLRKLVAGAARTRRNTLPGNARVYVAHTERGERICLAVRGGIVITVLDPRCAEAMYLRAPAAHPASPSHAQPSGAQDVGLVASLLADRSDARREKAASIVAAWKAGQPVASKTVRRAAQSLGLHEQQLARVRVEGGRFAGVCIEVREGDGVEDVLARFRHAMSERLGRRVAG